MDNTEESRIISLCSGYGGLELGIKRTGANVRTVAYVEIEAFACANLVAKMEEGKLDVAPIWTNLKTFDGRPFRHKVHGISGGYPCQPFSVAGKRQGEEDPRHLWPYIRGHIRTIEPLWVFFENVEGHLSLGFREVKRDLEEMGYRVEAGIFSAAEVGAPHQRKRLFILGHSKHTGFSAAENGGSINSQQEKGRLQEPEGRRSELAYTNEPGLQGLRRDESISLQDAGQLTTHSSNAGWPARHNEPQYDWEAPRTTEPGLGGTTNGTASRVDRLRLLGNGVVPATAERAWITLVRRIK